jgi:glutathione S-transferase
MTKMKLYYSPLSPYARKVRVVAMETELDRHIEMVNVAVSPVAPNADVVKHNPIGKVPALSVKGMDLFDSPVICEYLDSQHRGRKLLPRKGRERWVALRLQAMADGLLDAAILTRYEGALRPEDKRWPDWTNGQTKKIEDVLAQLEAEANSLKGKPTIGTISVACALGYLDYRFAAMDWRAKHPKLAKWFNSTAKTDEKAGREKAAGRVERSRAIAVGRISGDSTASTPSGASFTMHRSGRSSMIPGEHRTCATGASSATIRRAIVAAVDAGHPSRRG